MARCFRVCAALALMIVADCADHSPQGESSCDGQEDCAATETCAQGICVTQNDGCGDEVCDAGESCTDCEDDCGTCPQVSGNGIWISRADLMDLPTSGTAWSDVLDDASQNPERPDLTDQEQNANAYYFAKALVFARTGEVSYRDDVVGAITALVEDMRISIPPELGEGTRYSGRALSLGRELGAYVLAADLVNLADAEPNLDGDFRVIIRELLYTHTDSGPSSLVECHEDRPNNWGTHCAGARAAVAAYLNDTPELDRTYAVFRGWMGDVSSYAGFRYTDPMGWHCDESQPVGINPVGCTRDGHNIDGVLPDDQRGGVPIIV